MKNNNYQDYKNKYLGKYKLIFVVEALKIFLQLIYLSIKWINNKLDKEL
jgi:hypothetical protein